MKVTKKNKKKETAGLPAIRAIRDPFGGMMSLREAMDRLFDESFWWPFPGLENREEKRWAALFPKVDVSEKGNEVRLRADIPGIDPEKINIEVTEDSVTISGSVEKSEEEKNENYYRTERQFGQFSREIILPAKIDPNSVEAKAKNGTLFINLKKQASEQKKKVQVKVE